MFRKGYFGTPVEESVVQRMLRTCDFAVAGLGESGKLGITDPLGRRVAGSILR